jgi:DNA-binding transcriptional ArsR family regulator
LSHPTFEPRFARIASAIGEPTRALMLARLLDGRHYTATELAAHAGVGSSTASEHLKLLVEERLVRVRAQGRHRYFTLADGNVAHALEALLRVADGQMPETTRWHAPALHTLRHARSCYGHLAGELGVRLCACFIERGWVSAAADAHQEYRVTEIGAAQLNLFGLADGVARLQTPRALYGCVDWSERRDHFAGPVAVALLEQFISRGWLAREANSRVLRVTARGKTELIEDLLKLKGA